MRFFIFIVFFFKMPIAFGETLKIEIEERKFGKSEILVEIVLPSQNLNKKFPVY